MLEEAGYEGDSREINLAHHFIWRCAGAYDAVRNRQRAHEVYGPTSHMEVFPAAYPTTFRGSSDSFYEELQRELYSTLLNCPMPGTNPQRYHAPPGIDPQRHPWQDARRQQRPHAQQLQHTAQRGPPPVAYEQDWDDDEPYAQEYPALAQPGQTSDPAAYITYPQAHVAAQPAPSYTFPYARPTVSPPIVIPTTAPALAVPAVSQPILAPASEPETATERKMREDLGYFRDRLEQLERVHAAKMATNAAPQPTETDTTPPQ